MNIEAYDIETLRKIVRSLQEDNKNLKKQLSQLHIAYEERDVFNELNQNNAEYDYDQGGRIIHPNIITEYLANVFFYMFWGRRDVYAKRGKNGGYFPQCENFWNNLCPKQRGEKVYCENCNAKKWKELTLETIVEHLNGKKEDGSDVIGIYPLFPDGTCRFLVFDFDNHEKGSSIDDFANQGIEWKEEVDALRKICTANGIQSLVERSRSGKGAHIWIFFKSPIDASLARNFGLLLLEKGSSEINIKSFHYYDRMFPSQDTSSYLGNLVALPLQGQALKNGNSAFVDENWNAYPNQWDTLFKIKKLDAIDIENNMRKWQCELANSNQIIPHSLSEKRPKPWNKKIHFSKFDVIGKLHIVMCDGLYIDSINIFPRLHVEQHNKIHKYGNSIQNKYEKYRKYLTNI